MFDSTHEAELNKSPFFLTPGRNFPPSGHIWTRWRAGSGRSRSSQWFDFGWQNHDFYENFREFLTILRIVYGFCRQFTGVYGLRGYGFTGYGFTGLLRCHPKSKPCSTSWQCYFFTFYSIYKNSKFPCFLFVFASIFYAFVIFLWFFVVFQSIF